VGMRDSVMLALGAAAVAGGVGADAVTTAMLLQRGLEGNSLLVALASHIGALPAVLGTHAVAVAAAVLAWQVARWRPDLASPRVVAALLRGVAAVWWVAQGWNLLVLARVL
jgi:hypothetical protein